jgi:hypothetical protein
MFSYISMNWRGKPLISHEVIVNLIATTTTRKGLKIAAEIDRNIYTKGIHVPEEELEKLHIERASFMANGVKNLRQSRRLENVNRSKRVN